MRGLTGRPDAVVVGSGPNGLAAALRLAAAGLQVRVVERAERPGGGLRTEELIRPGYGHDVCSTVHPMGAAAPFFREFDLASRGVRLLHPEIAYAHPLDGGRASVSRRSLEETAEALGPDGPAYRRLFGPLVEHGQDVVDFFLTSRLRRPPTRSVAQVLKFVLNGLPNVRWLAHRHFRTDGAQALLAGAAAHGMLDLSRPLTAALGMVLGMTAHHAGWPVVEGGSQKLADAMVAALEEQGGEVVCGHQVTDLR
ncbi:MAG: phytoene desaturase family protein, partial [Actinomycetes bacterium]